MMVVTDKLWMGSNLHRNLDVEEIADDFAEKIGLQGREKEKMHLLLEETQSMVHTLLEQFSGELWLEQTDDGYRIILEADVRPHDKAMLPSTEVPEGFMARIAELLNCTFLFESASEVPDQFLENLPEYVREGMTDQDGKVWVGSWKLSNYRLCLAEQSDMEKLEQSIVATLADDVAVEVHQGKVRLVIVKKLR